MGARLEHFGAAPSTLHAPKFSGQQFFWRSAFSAVETVLHHLAHSPPSVRLLTFPRLCLLMQMHACIERAWFGTFEQRRRSKSLRASLVSFAAKRQHEPPYCAARPCWAAKKSPSGSMKHHATASDKPHVPASWTIFLVPDPERGFEGVSSLPSVQFVLASLPNSRHVACITKRVLCSGCLASVINLQHCAWLLLSPLASFCSLLGFPPPLFLYIKLSYYLHTPPRSAACL